MEKTTETEVKTTEKIPEPPSILADKTAETAALSVATAQAASALATTNAAEAEVDAAARMRDFQERNEAQWTAINSRISAMETTGAEVINQVQNLSMLAQSLAEKQVKTEETLTAAESILKPRLDVSPTDGPEKDGPKETEQSPKKGGTFRL